MIRALIICTLICLACAPAAHANAPADSPTRGASANARCYDDMPCWNWATMGNRQRGIVTTRGTRRVVSVCTFARLARSGRVNFARSGRMLGDATALRARCR